MVDREQGQDIVDARLRECAELSAAAAAAATGELARSAIDMSPEAVTDRIIELAEISALCFELASLRRSSEERREP